LVEAGGERVPPFRSILFDQPETDGAERLEPDFFGDLNLDQVVDAVLAGRDEYDLKPLFYAPLHDVAAVRYRHDVLRDLEADAVREVVEEFARALHRMRTRLAQLEKLHYPRQKQRWFLDAAEVYCDAVVALRDRLARVDLGSHGLRGFLEYLGRYLGSDAYRSLVTDIQALREQLAKVKYRVHIRALKVTVSRYDGDADYSAEVEKTFARFKQGAVKDYLVKFRDYADMNHVEAQILDQVARLYPDTFRALEQFSTRHRDYLDQTIGRFDREVQFYLAYLAHIRRFAAAGLVFSRPEISEDTSEIYADDAFDLALATKLRPGEPVVCNDLRLEGRERIFVVTGPNQGGKTTFARMVGQLVHLAALGLPVPASRARLFLPDRVFSHFEREENLATLRGKLDDELVRIHEILTDATQRSVIVMNESFASTTLRDALFIGTQVLGRIVDIGAIAVYVTFVDELASLDEACVSMVGAIVPDDPAQRTYKITRKPADGLAYAAAIANKYGLAYDSLRRRITR
jgi:DNA mismatch repair protein MutS